MRASVIIPTYNRPHILERLLACLVEQRDDVHEVLVCDDGSSADNRSVCLRFADRLPVRHLWQEDRGFRAGQARNMGIAQAVGDVLIFVDDDVLLPEGYVRAHLDAHRWGVEGAVERRIVLGFRHRSHHPPRGVCPTFEEMADGDPDDRIEPLGLDGAGLALSPHRWFFVYSCNFSVPNRPEIRFDDDFVGWGMEDVELGYRLERSHDYDVVLAPTARVYHIEDPAPRDPFRCVERGLEPCYDTYVHNMVRFIDKYPRDRQVYDILANDLRWYVRDADDAHWVKNGHENSADKVIATVRELERRLGRVG